MKGNLIMKLNLYFLFFLTVPTVLFCSQNKHNNVQGTKNDSLEIVSVEYSNSTPDSSATIEIFYPQIKEQGGNKIIKEINKFLENEFKESIDWYQEAAADSSNMEDYRFSYSFETGFTVEYNSSDFLSIVMDHYQYTGGAHGNYYTVGYNIRIRDGKLLKLEDIIDNDSIDILSTECEDGILELYDADSLTEAGLFDNNITILPDQDFYIIPGTLVLQFDPYEIAPYSMGDIKVEIPFDKISDILKPNLPFYKDK